MLLKTNDLDKATYKQEQIFIKRIEEQYKIAKKEIDKIIGEVFVKYSKDGKLTYDEMLKYDRLVKLQTNINAELTKLNRGTQPMYSAYLTDVYLLNAEGLAGKINEYIDTSIGILNRGAVYESALSPLSKGSLEDLSSQTRFRLRQSITQSLIKGEGIRPMSQGIQKALETSANRSVKIARTETTRIMNQARMDTLKNAETENIKLMKVWVATRDDRTRDSHARLNGEIVELDETFSNGLNQPGDLAGPPEEVINCRCSLATEIVIDDLYHRKIT